MSVYRTVFLGTPEFAKTCLQSMIDDEHFDVVGVVTQPDRPSGRKMKLTPSVVKTLALKHNIPTLAVENINSREVLEAIKTWNAGAAVVVAFGQIVSQEFLNMFPLKVVNVHASLLPHLRGAAPIQRAIMQGDAETGVALQVMVKKLDAGDVLGVRATPITDKKDALTLHDELALLGCDLIAIEFMDYLRGNLTPTPQEESKSTYAKKIEKSEAQANWELSAREIFNQQRGLKLGPGLMTLFDKKRLKLHALALVDTEPLKGYKPGEVIDVFEDSFTVFCGQGTVLKVVEVQPESKSKMSSSDFIRGYSLKKGMVLGE